MSSVYWNGCCPTLTFLHATEQINVMSDHQFLHPIMPCEFLDSPEFESSRATTDDKFKVRKQFLNILYALLISRSKKENIMSKSLSINLPTGRSSTGFSMKFYTHSLFPPSYARALAIPINKHYWSDSTIFVSDFTETNLSCSHNSLIDHSTCQSLLMHNYQPSVDFLF